MAVSANIFSKCLPARSTDLIRCGDPTLCDISPTTENELASIYQDATGRWRIIGALLETDFMGKACEVKENGMYDLIRANSRDLGSRKLTITEIKRGLHEVMPFVMMESKGPLNNEYWTATGGNSAGGTFNGAAYDYRVDVTSQTSIPNDVNWFPERIRVYIMTRTAGGSKSTSYWQVVGSELTGGVIRLYLAEQNTASPFSAAEKTPPLGAQFGVLVRSTPNVNRYEKYCAEIPAINAKRKTPFWLEEVRYSMCDSDLWRKFIQAIKQSNPYYEELQHVEDVERNRQIVEDFQRRHAWAFFYNPPLANQTMTGWDELETININSDDLVGNYTNHPLEGRCIGRRAHAVGIYHQLKECARIMDAQGDVLNLIELHDLLYEIMRVRESNGLLMKPGDCGPVITIMTDSLYAKQIAQAYYAYFKAVSQSMLVMNMDISACSKSAAFGFRYQRFALDYPMIELRVATHPFFDDLLNAKRRASAGLVTHDVWILDWSTNWQGNLSSNVVTNRTGSIQEVAAVNEEFLCVMDIPKESRQLRSITYANVSECPRASYLIENLSPLQPEHEGRSGATNYYGTYA